MQFSGPSRWTLSLSATGSLYPVPLNHSISGLLLKDSASEPKMPLREKRKRSPLEPCGPQATAMVSAAAAGAPAGAPDAATTTERSRPTPTVRPRGSVP